MTETSDCLREAIKRVGEHRTGAHCQALRDDNAPFEWIEPLQGRMQKKSLPLVLGTFPGIRDKDEVGLDRDDRLQSREPSGPKSEIGRCVGEARCGEKRRRQCLTA